MKHNHRPFLPIRKRFCHFWRPSTLKSLLSEVKRGSGAKDHRPLLLAVQDHLQNLFFPDIACHKTVFPLEVVDAMFQVTQAHFKQVVPSSFHEAVQEKCYWLNSHIPEHHLVKPFPPDLTQVDALLWKKLMPPYKVVVDSLHKTMVLFEQRCSAQVSNFVHNDLNSPKYDFGMVIFGTKSDMIGDSETCPDVEIRFLELGLILAIVYRVFFII